MKYLADIERCPVCGETIGDEDHEHDINPKFTEALTRTMIEETSETIRHLDYELAVHRTRLAWLRAIQRGTIKP